MIRQSKAGDSTCRGQTEVQLLVALSSSDNVRKTDSGKRAAKLSQRDQRALTVREARVASQGVPES